MGRRSSTARRRARARSWLSVAGERSCSNPAPVATISSRWGQSCGWPSTSTLVSPHRSRMGSCAFTPSLNLVGGWATPGRDGGDAGFSGHAGVAQGHEHDAGLGGGPNVLALLLADESVDHVEVGVADHAENRLDAVVAQGLGHCRMEIDRLFDRFAYFAHSVTLAPKRARAGLPPSQYTLRQQVLDVGARPFL